MASRLTTENVAIQRLRPYAKNPRRGDIAAIKESLEQNGQYRPIVVRRKTKEVLAGNHTLRAARELGWTEIAVTYIDCDARQAKRIVLADNRTNDLASYDNEVLAQLLGELPDLVGTGYDQASVDELLAELEPKPQLGEDAPPPLPSEPETKFADLYELGRHRLLCADAREAGCYKRLLDGKRADVLWTDPPYGVAYEGKTKRKLRIEGDEESGLAELLAVAFSTCDGALRAGAPLYVASPGGRRGLVFGNAFVEAGWQLRQTLIWLKDALVLGRGDYHHRHELLLYGFKPGQGRLGRGGKRWYGGDGATTVFEAPKPSASRDHPTMKPPELIAQALANSSRAGAVVLDPFAGSGSTLVAAEQTGRRSYLLELEPAYCDVIVRRYESLTGKRAQRRR